MKISVNGKELFSLTATQKKVIENEIPSEMLDADLKRRLCWSIEHEYGRAFKTFKNIWDVKLAELGVASVPADPVSYAALVFARPECDVPVMEEDSTVISVDDKELMTVTKDQKRILRNFGQIEARQAKTMDDWISLRLRWIMTHKHDNCFLRLKRDWEKKLVSAGVTEIPLDKGAFAELVFSQDGYKNRSTRDAEDLGVPH